MFATFDDLGRLFVFEATETNEMETDTMLASPTYQIRLLRDADLDGIFEQSTIYAGDIPFPMGGAYHNGSLIVAASPDVLKFTDTDQDGRADKREVLLTGWTLNRNGAILSGPFIGPDGWMYLADARRGFDITTLEGQRLQGKGARIWRCLPDGSRLEWLSGGGFDNSIEIDFMPNGDPIGTMTYFRDPAEGQRDALIHWVEGGVYPKPHPVIREDALKLTGDLMPVITKMARVAPSGIVRFRGDSWGGEYRDDWFSAIFNTGQILRHKIIRQGASYSSREESFLVPQIPDFHPTDVLQDGNGDLLVVVTGGWFIHGCPLSQVAKPEVQGGIYRIRKDHGRRWEDPWGTQISFRELSVFELTGLLSDERDMVRKRTVEELISRGDSARQVFEERLHSDDEEIRLESLFALFRMHSEGTSLLMSLSDSSPLVRVAAARLAGLSKFDQARPVLEERVIGDQDLAVRRQAATALGQMGDPAAIPSLLEAAIQVEDRFLLHAIRYALISFNKPALLSKALQQPDPSQRITALIALDQMENKMLAAADLQPFLESDLESLREAGIWVLKHHPEWSTYVAGLVRVWLEQGISNDLDLENLQVLSTLFCDDLALQQIIYSGLKDDQVPEHVRLILIESLAKCSARITPQGIAILQEALERSTGLMQGAILGLIESRQLSEMEPFLTDLLLRTEDPVQSLKILRAKISSKNTLTTEDFEQVTLLLERSNAIPVRRMAMQILSRVSLDDQQYKFLAGQPLQQADEITFPGIVRLFLNDSVASTGRMLINSLDMRKEMLVSVTENELQNIFAKYPEDVYLAAAPLLELLKNQNEERRNYLLKKEQSLLMGDVGRGRDLFYGKALCSTCHAVGTDGSDFGPDLSNIGEIRSIPDLMEAIIYPHISLAREYETYQIRTAGQSYTGILKETMYEGRLLVKMAPDQMIQLSTDEIISIEQTSNSLMPSGLDKNLSDQELSDLLAFLEALPYDIERLIKISN